MHRNVINKTLNENMKNHIKILNTIRTEDLSNCELEDVYELYKYYVKELKNINDYIINNLQKHKLSKEEYKQRRKTIIIHLDNLEEKIMKHNWDGIHHNYYCTHYNYILTPVCIFEGYY